MEPPSQSSFISTGLPSLHSFFEPGLVQMARKSKSHDAIPFASTAAQVGMTSTFATTMNLTTAMVGAGVLAIPKLFSLAGWYAAPVMLLFSGWTMAESGIAMSRTLDLLDERAKAGSGKSCPQTYDGLAELAFGRAGQLVTRVIVNCFMLCFATVLIILVGSGLEIISGAWLPYRIWVLIVYVPFVGVAVLGNMHIFSRFAVVGVIASIVYVFAIANAGFMAGASQGAPLWVTHVDPNNDDTFTYSLAPASLGVLGKVQAVMLFGYGYQYMLPTVRAEMALPHELPYAIYGSVGLGAVFYMTVGVLGYYGWGDAVADMVATTMANQNKCHCPGAWMTGFGLSVAVVANVVVTFPIVAQCLATGVETVLDTTHSSPVRFALVTAIVVVGLCCPYFLDVVGIFSALLGTSIFLFLPIAFHWRVQGQGYWAALKHTVVVVAGLVALIFGFYESVSDLIISVNKGGGNPFTNFMRPLNPQFQ